MIIAREKLTNPTLTISFRERKKRQDCKRICDTIEMMMRAILSHVVVLVRKKNKSNDKR
jgi:hypothetical protein